MPPPQMSLPWLRTQGSSQYSQWPADVSLSRGSEGPLWTAWALQTFCVLNGTLQSMHGSIQRSLNTYSVLSNYKDEWVTFLVPSDTEVHMRRQHT